MEQLKVGDKVEILRTDFEGEYLSVGRTGVVCRLGNMYVGISLDIPSPDSMTIWNFYYHWLKKIPFKNTQEEPDSFETQIKQVFSHLQKWPITSWEAINTYRITRLSAVIHELRKNNTITSVWENNGKTGKEKKRWTKYTLIK